MFEGPKTLGTSAEICLMTRVPALTERRANVQVYLGSHCGARTWRRESTMYRHYEERVSRGSSGFETFSVEMSKDFALATVRMYMKIYAHRRAI